MSHSSIKKRNMLYRSMATLGRVVSTAAVKYHYHDINKLPQDGAFIVCPNHLTNADPIAVAHMLYRFGYTPQFLAKGALFKIKPVGYLFNHTGQIPVYRDANPSEALRAAKAAVDDGAVVVMYPEGTFTRDPKRWPMKGKTGAARLALETGTPVIPVAHWGLLDFMPIGGYKFKVGKRVDVNMIIGDSVDLSEFEGKEITRDVLDQATEKIMSDITELLEGLRDEKAPAHRWDAKKDGFDIVADDGSIIEHGIEKDS